MAGAASGDMQAGNNSGESLILIAAKDLGGITMRLRSFTERGMNLSGAWSVHIAGVAAETKSAVQ